MTLSWRNREEARRWFKTSEPITSETHISWYEKYIEKDDDFLFIVEHENRPVGQASVYGIQWENGQAEVGRFLAAPGEAGKGYIRNACTALIRLCQNEFGLKYLFLDVLESNHHAINLYRQQGFTNELHQDGFIRMGLALPREKNNDSSD